MFDADYRAPTEKQNKKIIDKINRIYGKKIKWYSSLALRDYKKICLSKYKYIPDSCYAKEKIRTAGEQL